ncbi:hypothetical protein H8B06_19065 [Sphingobacterium sp. DN00404]|uniref:Uncharacterized protein n=1 Tax=Sphingobacterium micropteri TaxID=2763501 RepID=A0ABR7YUB7_9SPHI|nr:hypothetical protein [Sphingobacterium micropteri]MBD1434930.1 hypothetical protein [Sphingobacterium micropteri]
MFEKFQMAVRNAYLDLKNEGRLDFGRECPSPGKLRSWCLKRYLENLNHDDEKVFIDFFNSGKSSKDLSVLIEKFDLDKLKPLRSFINGDTKKRPDENIVKLLAVLIDFKPRPYNASHWNEDSYGDNLNNNGENPPTSSSDSEDFPSENLSDTAEAGKEGHTPEAIDQAQVTTTEYKQDIKPIERKSKNKTLLYAGSGLVLASVFFIVYNIITPADCMCWNGARYVEVDCQDKGQPYQIIGLDKNKLAHFQKITRPDTLNDEDIGKVWYSKINNEVEFFTYPGHHPIKQERSLKAVTKHIIERYAGEYIKEE